MKNIKIISIEKKQKSTKYKVITDDLDYTVSEDMIIKHQLFKDKIFTENEFKQVIEDILEDKYFNKVLNLLSYSSKSEYEIITYIHTNEFKNKEFLKENQINNIINKLKQLGYINDELLCVNVIDYYIRNNKGPLFIKQKLKEKKIEDNIINDKLLCYDSSLEEEIIVKLLSKENNKNYTLKKFKNTLANKLIRNGFNSSLVFKLIEKQVYEDNSNQLIEKDFLKVYNKVIKKDNKTDGEKKQLIINSLLSKGYEYQLIKDIIKEKF